MFVSSALAQKSKEIRLQNYESYFLHYGMFVGGHISRYALRYSDDYITKKYDTLQSINVRNTPGFKVGFILNGRITDWFNFRLLPSVGFYEKRLDYHLTDGRITQQLNDYTLLELPILLKFKSQRFLNTRVYVVAGVTPGYEAKIRKEEISVERMIHTSKFILAAEVGVGLDLYMSFFKLSPEIRYSHALSNVLLNEPDNVYHGPISSLIPHYFAFYIHFEGGAY